MKYRDWKEKGGCGLSENAQALLCQSLECRRKDLEEMELERLLEIDPGGLIAAREIARWSREHPVRRAVPEEPGSNREP